MTKVLGKVKAKEKKNRTFHVSKLKVDPQGHQANVNGLALEKRVEEELARYGIESKSEREYLIEGGPDKVLLKNVRHTTYYGAQGRHEFSLKGVIPGDVRIECRSQRVAGTVDEKFPHLLNNVAVASEGVVWIILDGNGFRAGLVDWIQKNANAIRYKKIKVFESFNSFRNWLNVVLG